MPNPERSPRKRRAELPPLQFLSPLHKATRQLSIHLQAQMDGHGLSADEGHVLVYVRKFAPCPVGELSRVFGYSKSTLTGVLDRLEQAKFIARKLNPADRRSFLVAITPAGERKGAALRAISEACEQRIALRTTAADRHGFRRVMDAIAAITHVDVRPNR